MLAAIVATLLFVLATAAAPQAARAADGDAVRIPDAPLKAAINAALGAGRPSDQEVTVAEARTITSLTASGEDGVSSLVGAEALTGLKNLTVSADRGLTDVTPLAGLGLTSLTITGGALQGTLESIGSLSALTSLMLIDDRVQDVAPLRGLSRLQQLYLSDNEIVDVAPLNDLTLLTSLDLRANRIASISALTRLTRLSRLDVSSNRIEEISVLSRYTSTLGLSSLANNRISDFSVLLPALARPASTGQQVYVGPYQLGGMHVPLERAEGHVDAERPDGAERRGAAELDGALHHAAGRPEHQRCGRGRPDAERRARQPLQARLPGALPVAP
jgi:internalin A